MCLRYIHIHQIQEWLSGQMYTINKSYSHKTLNKSQYKLSLGESIQTECDVGGRWVYGAVQQRQLMKQPASQTLPVIVGPLQKSTLNESLLTVRRTIQLIYKNPPHYPINSHIYPYNQSIMRTLPILPLLLFLYSVNTLDDPTPTPIPDAPKICDGNHFKFISTYALGKQNDLDLTLAEMEPQTHVEPVSYKDVSYRTYTISSFKVSFTYMNAKQDAIVDNIHRLKVFGASLKINYTFLWEKKQLSSSINGTGKGVVSTDPISFMKSLDINSTTKQLEWNFVSAEPIKITNSLTISEFNPYKVADFDIINEMLNEIKGGGTTVKDKLVKALNQNFTNILKRIVHQNNDTYKEPQYIEYSHSDYRGDFIIGYDNFIISHSLEQGHEKGLELMLSETTRDDPKFVCGPKVPSKPDDTTVFGGLQEFISNSFLLSTLRYAIDKGFLDVVLTEQFWQSPAFQFYAGDLHEVMPSTKNITSLTPLDGKCKAMDDKVLSLKMKTMETYDFSVNFTCYVQFTNNKTTLIEINIAVDYVVKPRLKDSYINFEISSISGQPIYIQHSPYLIKNMELANFMVMQTLNMVTNNLVIGSGFKTMIRKSPQLVVRSEYLFLYDKATIRHASPNKKHLEQL